MSENVQPNVCPQCGAPIPSEAPQGLCPRCVLDRAAAPTEPDPSTGSQGHAAPSLEAVRTAFPHLEILELIGSGGMGAVFKVRQVKLDRLVALKLLHTPLARNATFAERFQREARLLAKLSHPNIVAVFDFGEAGGFFYLLMEFVEGVNLRQAMRSGSFGPVQALAVVPKVCEALQFAHEHGVLHRDIKPENILLDAQGRVKIADFGIAKLVHGGKGDVTLTASGAALGTPAYMAPEQIERPGDVDHRADIYSLGVVFYEMLTGELPLGRFAPPSQKTPLDARVDEIVLKALAKERELRQQSADEVKTEIEGVTSAPPRAGPAPGVVSPASAPLLPGVGGAPSTAALPPPAPPGKTSWKAVVSAVLAVPVWLQGAAASSTALVSLFRRDAALSSGWFFPIASFGGSLALVGLVFGVLALGDIRRGHGRVRGSGLALMGVLGIPFGLGAALAPGLILMLAAVVHLPPALGRRLYELAPLLWVGVLVLLVKWVKPWFEPTPEGQVRRPGPNALALAFGGGALGVLLLASPVILNLGRQPPGPLPALEVEPAEKSPSDAYGRATGESGLRNAAATAEVAVSVPSRETFVVSALVLSNGVPVDAGPLRAKLWPPGARGMNPYRVSWSTLPDAGSATNSAPWEFVVEDGTSQTLAARLRPQRLPQLAWTLSPAATQRLTKTVGRALQTFEIARALQTAAAGSEQAGVADWSLRLQLQSSPAPPRAGHRGAKVAFELPPRQAVTFELVRQANGQILPVPNLAAFFVNGADESHSGEFLVADDPDDLDSLTGLPRWRFGLEGAVGRMTETGVPPTIPIPEDLMSGRHWSVDSWQQLEPDSEVIVGSAQAGDANALYSVRIRTATIAKLPGVREQASGRGTNWTASVSARPVRPALDPPGTTP